MKLSLYAIETMQENCLFFKLKRISAFPSFLWKHRIAVPVLLFLYACIRKTIAGEFSNLTFYL